MLTKLNCLLCGSNDPLVAGAIGCCVNCIREHPSEALPLVMATRKKVEKTFFGKANTQHDFENRTGRTPGKKGLVAMGFYDDHPANCIASWQCPGTTGIGYPKFTASEGCEKGNRNLAVFTAGCNFSCLFCQDWIHKTMLQTGKPFFTDKEIVSWIDDKTTCVCFCGGTPDIQMDDVTRITNKMRAQHPGQILRFCAETNLTAPWKQLLPFAEIVYESGGGFNVGLKAGSEHVHKALTGTSQKQVWRNLENLYNHFGLGKTVPFIRPSLLIVPGYIDDKEVQMVTRKLARLSNDFSLKIIGLIPRFLMMDVPFFHEENLLSLATIVKKNGLQRVSPSLSIKETERFIR